MIHIKNVKHLRRHSAALTLNMQEIVFVEIWPLVPLACNYCEQLWLHVKFFPW